MRNVFLIMIFFSSTSYAFITGKEWMSMNIDEKVGYVMAIWESQYRVAQASDEQKKTYDCVAGLDLHSDDFTNIVDIQYKDVSNYSLPAFYVFNTGLRKVCGQK